MRATIILLKLCFWCSHLECSYSCLNVSLFCEFMFIELWLSQNFIALFLVVWSFNSSVCYVSTNSANVSSLRRDHPFCPFIALCLTWAHFPWLRDLMKSETSYAYLILIDDCISWIKEALLLFSLVFHWSLWKINSQTCCSHSLCPLGFTFHVIFLNLLLLYLCYFLC